MEEIKVGEWVRTKNGYIIKTTEKTIIFNLGYKEEYIDMETTIYGFPYEKEIVNHDEKIIELVEVGDYVNGGYVFEIGKAINGDKWVHTLNGLLLYNQEIQTILTHEQFEQNCYKLD